MDTCLSLSSTGVQGGRLATSVEEVLHGSGEWRVSAECSKYGEEEEAECEFSAPDFVVGGGGDRVSFGSASAGVGRSQHRPPARRMCPSPRFRWALSFGRRKCVPNRRRRGK